MRTALGLAPLIIALLVFEAVCLALVVRRPVKVLPRWAWAIVCLISIPVGGIVFLLVGRGDPRQPDEARPEPTHEDLTRPAPPGAAAGGAAPQRAVIAADAVDRGPGGRPSTPAAPGRVPATREGASARTGPDRNAPPAIATTNLTKRYPGHVALDGVSITVPTGSVFGLVGPNGAGKTTLLGLLAGLRRPSEGSVTIAPARDQVALLPDTPHFEPWLTAWEVVDLARQLTRPSAGADRTEAALERAGLLDAAHRRTGGFSRGMLQRLGLAATIVGEPAVLLLDEPCSALDPQGRRDVLDLVGRLGGDHTVLFCSHILDDVQEVCDTVGILRDGALLFQGGLSDLLVGRASAAYTIRARAPIGPIADALHREPWVRAVEQLGAEELRVTVAGLDEAERHLAAALASSSGRIISVVPSGADLEQVFLELMR